jgi:hypothetical protein
MSSARAAEPQRHRRRMLVRESHVNFQAISTFVATALLFPLARLDGDLTFDLV